VNWIKEKLSSNKVYIIAEAGINHNGSFDLALELARQANECGADCVKFQTFRTSASESKTSTKPGYFSGRIGTVSKKEWSRSLEFSVEQFRQLKDYCQEIGIAFLSTACDIEGLRILQEIGAEVIKIASADTNNDYLLKAVRETGIPVILSTGMSDLEEVAHAVDILRPEGIRDLALMQCTSQYPTPCDQINLRVIRTFRDRFDCPVGFSDHSQGIHVAVAAVACGAVCVEKHFTLSRNLPGVDHAASIEPDELAAMVRQIRDVEAAMGDGVKAVQDIERGNIAPMRRSLMAARDLKAGERLEEGDITAKRPGTGLAPTEIGKVIGRVLKRDLSEEDLLSLEMLE
jgi:N,N'-diacetyllegionaminate synthase